MKALIFGINGQDGYYLNLILKSKNIETIGVSRSDGAWVKGNITDKKFVNELIKNQKPDFIFHLAANSTTHYEALFENHETISTGTYILLDAVKNYSPRSKVFITGSGVQFKNNGVPIKESDAFEGNSPYSVSRIQSVYAARYFRYLGLKVYVGYLFHHDSPLRTERHVNQKIARAVMRIANGSAEIIELGDIDIRKEYTFAGDIIEAIWILVNQKKIFETVIGTGIAYSIRYWLNLCFQIAGLDWKNKVITNKEYTSPNKLLVSDPETIFQLGWQPKTHIEQLAKMMMI